MGRAEASCPIVCPSAILALINRRHRVPGRRLLLLPPARPDAYLTVTRFFFNLGIDLCRVMGNLLASSADGRLTRPL